MKNYKEEKMKILDKKAFSLAEMMIVMLIVSIALVAMTPIMTKQLKSTKGAGITMADIDKEIDDKLKNYYTKGEIDNMFRNYYTKAEVNNLLGNYYTKSEINNSFDAVNKNINDINKNINDINKNIKDINDILNNLPKAPDLSSYATKDQVNYAILASLPVGTIVAYDTNSAVPAGWHVCDGSAINGIQTPDLRGRFIRGLDSSRALNSFQDSANKEHYHGLYSTNGEAGEWGRDRPIGLGSYLSSGVSTDKNFGATNGYWTFYFRSGRYSQLMSKGFNADGNTTTDDVDAHPKNVAMYYIMKISKVNYL